MLAADAHPPLPYRPLRRHRPTQNFAQVMTTVGLRIPMQRALRGGMMIGAEVISVAELMQYALIIVSSA
jgi:hypothetical protein